MSNPLASTAFSMRPGLVIAAVLVALVGAAIWWSQQPDEAAGQSEPQQEAGARFTPVEVQREDGQGLALTGVVRTPGGEPIAGATVQLAATAQQSFLDVRCGFCGRPLLQCRSPESARTFTELLDGHRGELRAALTTRTDAEGRFRFERLAGVSFTVWADAAGFGTGVKDRAAPGDPVTLVLPSPRTLEGTVRDEAGRPLAARLRLTSERLATARDATSDGAGRFVFEGLGEGPFALAATAPGMVPLLRAGLDANAGRVGLTLFHARALEVRVVHQGKPADAEVLLENDHLQRSVRTHDGVALIDDLARGELVVTAREGALASAPQQVALREARTAVTLELSPAGTLMLTALDEDGQPAPSPSVELRTVSGRRLTRRVLQTGEPGRLGPIAAGEYELHVEAPGHRELVQPVTIPVGERALEVTLERAFVITGTVVDEYGRPAPEVAVLVTPGGETPHSDRDGRFSITLESPGLYRLQAHHSDWGGGELKVTAPASDVVLQLAPGAGVEVLVTLEGRPVEGASVSLVNQKGSFQSDRASGADGLVLMRGLPPDTYSVFAARPDSLPSAPQAVTVEDGSLEHVTAELKSGGVITGQVVDGTGAPVADVGVSLRRGASSISDAEGHFELKPVAGDRAQPLQIASRRYRAIAPVLGTPEGPPVRVVVEALPLVHGRVVADGAPLTSFEVNGEAFTSSDGRFEVSLRQGPSTTAQLAIEAPGYEPQVFERELTRDELGDFELHRLAALEGVVRDGAGEAVADAIVSCEPCARSVTSDAQGRFTLSKPFLQREFTVTAKKSRRTATKKVEAKSTERLELVLAAGVKVTGHGFLPDGSPAAGVEVNGFCSDTGENVRAVTDAAGGFTFDVSPGNWSFSLRSGFARSAVDPPTQILEVTGPSMELTLGPAPGLETVAVRLTPTRGAAIWLVRGELQTLGNPPLELLHAPWAQMIFQPMQPRVVFGGVPAGRYTVVWGLFHAPSSGGVKRLVIDVPVAAEVEVPP